MRQIRAGVFETNSSSTHSLTIVTAEEYKKWGDGELFLDGNDNNKFITPEEKAKRIDELNSNNTSRDARHWDYQDLFLSRPAYADQSDNLEFYSKGFVTPSGDHMVAFGIYGYNR